jgi:hypothetical protein
MAWWRRRRTPAHAALPARRQATWAAAAFPPEVEAAVAAAVAAPPIVPTQRSESAVRLGFDDGSEMQLAAEDPRARALQAVADLLIKTEPAPPTTNNETHQRDVRRTV